MAAVIICSVTLIVIVNCSPKGPSVDSHQWYMYMYLLPQVSANVDHNQSFNKAFYIIFYQSGLPRTTGLVGDLSIKTDFV